MGKYIVYVLKKNENPIYVGSTTTIKKRIKEHKNSGKDFDSYIILSSFNIKSDALIAERTLIKFLVIFGSSDVCNLQYPIEAFEKFQKISNS